MTRRLAGGARGASAISYSPVPPDTSTDVQSALDWRSRHIGSGVVVDSYADLVFLFGPAVGGVFTIDQNVSHTGPVAMPAGERLVMTASGSWTGSSIKTPLLGDVDAPLFSGPLDLNRFVISNTNVGLSAMDIDGFSSGPLVLIENVVFTGTRSGKIHDAVGIRVINCIYFGGGCLDGLKISGTNGPIRYADNAAADVGANFGALAIDATTTFTGLGMVGCTFDLPLPTQYGIAIDTAIVVPPANVIQLVSMLNSVPSGGAMLRQNVGDMLEDDIRLVVESCPSLPRWSAVGLAFREDSANPLTVNLSGVNPQVVPFREGASLPETELLGPKRCTLFKDAGNNNNTYIQYDGPKLTVSAVVKYTLSVSRAGGGSNLLRCSMQRDDAPGYTGFTEIQGSSLVITNGATLDEASSSTSLVVDPGDRVRLVLEDLEGAADAEVAVLQYGILVSS